MELDFGNKLAECRKAKGLSQKDLAKLLKTSHSVIGKYEREEMTPSIEAAVKLAGLLDTTVLLPPIPFSSFGCILAKTVFAFHCK